MKYRCLSCNYIFEGEKPKVCPWCGKKNIVPEKTAEELLKEREIDID